MNFFSFLTLHIKVVGGLVRTSVFPLAHEQHLLVCFGNITSLSGCVFLFVFLTEVLCV